jgi:hypothetical protein
MTYFFVLVLGAAVFAGCGGGIQLRGTVTFSEDGTPVDTGTVCFVSNSGSMSRGELNSDGTYLVSTNKPGDGILPGTYTVYLINTEKTEQVPVGREGEFTDRTIQTVDSKYTSPAKSSMTCTVDQSTKTFDFKVERYKRRQ